jgi:hypothetical protein
MMTAVFLVLGFRLRQGYGGQVVSAQSQGFQTCSFAEPRQEPKILTAHRCISYLNALKRIPERVQIPFRFVLPFASG